MADSAAALRDSVETSTFASLRIWRDKLQADLAEPARPGGFKLRMLLEQGKGECRSKSRCAARR